MSLREVWGKILPTQKETPMNNYNKEIIRFKDLNLEKKDNLIKEV